MIIVAKTEDEFRKVLTGFVSLEITTLREKRGFNLRDINEVFGISIAHLSSISNNKGLAIALNTLFDIVVVLGFSYAYQVQRNKSNVEYKCVLTREQSNVK